MVVDESDGYRSNLLKNADNGKWIRLSANHFAGDGYRTFTRPSAVVPATVLLGTGTVRLSELWHGTQTDGIFC
jgi:hypothetical protein